MELSINISGDVFGSIFTTIQPDGVGHKLDNNSDVLLRLNDEEAMNRLTVMIYLGLVAVIGTIGNIHVLVVYFFKFKKSNNRTFVLALAVVDTLSCLFCMTFEIFDMRYPYMFYASTACRVFRYNNTVMGIGSALLLVVIAIERYRKICRPLKRQMTYKAAKIFCSAAILVALIMAIPAAFINGHRTVELAQNVTGVDCTTNDEIRKTNLPLTFAIVLSLLVIICFGILVFIYAVIGKNLIHQIKIRETKLVGANSTASCHSNTTGDEDTEHTSEVSECSVTSAVMMSTENLDNHVTTTMSHSDLTQRYKPTISENSPPSVESSSVEATGVKMELQQTMPNKESSAGMLQIEKKTLQATKVFFAITVIFILAHLPHSILVYIVFLKNGFVEDMDPLQSSAHRIAMRLYYINNAVNPIIYGFCGGKFRKHCKEMYTTFFCFSTMTCVDK